MGEGGVKELEHAALPQISPQKATSDGQPGSQKFGIKKDINVN